MNLARWFGAHLVTRIRLQGINPRLPPSGGYPAAVEASLLTALDRDLATEPVHDEWWQRRTLAPQVLLFFQRSDGHLFRLIYDPVTGRLYTMDDGFAVGAPAVFRELFDP